MFSRLRLFRASELEISQSYHGSGSRSAHAIQTSTQRVHQEEAGASSVTCVIHFMRA